jgi:hypothetical protein
VHALEKVLVVMPSVAQIGAYIMVHMIAHSSAAVSAMNIVITAEYNTHRSCQIFLI